MKTRRHYIYSILEQYSGFNITDDIKVDEFWLGDIIDEVRATLIREQFRTSGVIDGAYYQATCCYEVKCEKITCTHNGQTIDSGEVVFYIEKPDLIENIGMNNILYLGPAGFNKHEKYTRVSIDGFLAFGGSEWVGSKPHFVELGDKLLINNLTPPGTKYLCMIAALKSPISICDYREDTPYPVPSGLKLEMLVKKHLFSTYGLPFDEISDARDAKMTQDADPRQAQQIQKSVNDE